MHATRVRSEEVHFVATSATLADGADLAAPARLQQFLADIAGVPKDRVRVMTGKRATPPLPAVRGELGRQSPDLDQLMSATAEERYAAVASKRECLDMRSRLGESPTGALTLAELTSIRTSKQPLHHTPDDRFRTLTLLDLCSTARETANGQWFLPLRAHLFHRAQSGVWACCNSKCCGRGETPLDNPAWSFGKIFLERRDRCDSCVSTAYELVLCVECGEEYLLQPRKHSTTEKH